MGQIIIIGLMCITLYWIGGIYYSIRNGANEIIKGLNSIDERLAALESRVRSETRQSDARDEQSENSG